VVLCRNVLIYLAAADVQRFLERAREALVPGGWLVLGGAEALVHRVAGLETKQVGDMFAYRKAESPRMRSSSATAVARTSSSGWPAS
jgi:chemotaxis protein methyltransferase CheR